MELNENATLLVYADDIMIFLETRKIKYGNEPKCKRE